MKYIDETGVCRESETKQDRLLETLYSSFWGRMLLKPLIQPAVSKAGGWLLDQSFSKCLIQPFIKANHMDMSPYIKREYSSYNDFFTREIKPEERMIDYKETHLVSPSDGKVSAYVLKKDTSFWVKHTRYQAESILRSKKLAEKYQCGCLLIIRLTVDDYHRYCYPADGVKTKNFTIPGVFHTVNPAACQRTLVYKENAREFTLLKTKRFGEILQMEVGALMVGRICNYHQKAQVKKGQEKGRFEFGGSTILLFLEKDKVRLAKPFIENTEKGYETLVRMGQCIGEALE